VDGGDTQILCDNTKIILIFLEFQHEEIESNYIKFVYLHHPQIICDDSSINGEFLHVRIMVITKVIT